jgi:hypothetical protein
MTWEMQTAAIGEDAMTILARAQLYEEYILGFDAGEAARIAGPGASVALDPP